MRLSLCHAQGTNPYRNLALERYLLETVAPDEIILFLWQNQNTVVIGRNQSALAECRIQQLEQDGGHLTRRLSGGGAVYHDMGNLNFTFLAPTPLFNEQRQTETVLRAVQMLGVDAQRTGRNDLLAGGAKFSGHAYYRTQGCSYHHGTLLVNVDTQKMARYLNPSPLKLAAKGVSSVKARVCNLGSFGSGITVPAVSKAMEAAFAEVYDGIPEEVALSASASEQVEAYAKRFASREWLLRGEEVLPYSREARFDWGCVRIDWEQQQGAISKAALFSDGLEADFLAQVPGVLIGCPVQQTALKAALGSLAITTFESSEQAKRTCIEDIVSLIV